MAKELHTGTQAPGGTSGGHGKAFPPMDPTTFPSQLLWLALTFGALYLIMTRTAVPRIGQVIDDRRDRIQRDLDQAESLKNETETALAEYEQALAEAKQKASGIANQERAKVTAEAEQKRAVAEEREAAKMAEAEARISAARAKALSSVDEIAAETANSIVEKLIGVKSTPDEIKKALAGTLK